jgi:hypothetical protein
MYQASDGKWYPVEHMPQNYQQQGGYGGGYGGGGYGQQQPIYVQQQGRPGGAGAAGTGAAAGVGCCGKSPLSSQTTLTLSRALWYASLLRPRRLPLLNTHGTPSPLRKR